MISLGTYTPAQWVSFCPQASTYEVDYEPVGATETISAAGVLTLTRRAVKRRWKFSSKGVNEQQWKQLLDMFRASPGPLWLWDSMQQPGNLLPGRVRDFTGLYDASGKPWRDYVPGVQLTIPPATVVYQWPNLTSAPAKRLFPVTAGVQYTITASMNSVDPFVAVAWRDAAGKRISEFSATGTGAVPRKSSTATAPANAVYGSMHVRNTSATKATTVADIAVSQGAEPYPPGIVSVLLRDAGADQVSSGYRTLSIEAAEV